MSHSQPTEFPTSMANLSLSLANVSSRKASLRCSTTAARTMKGAAAETRNACNENMLAAHPCSLKGPRSWTAPQIDRTVTTITEVVIPSDPKRNTDHNKNGMRAYSNAGEALPEALNVI